MTKLLTPPSLNTAKRPSPPSENRSAPRPDIAPVLLAMTPRLLPPVLLPPQKGLFPTVLLLMESMVLDMALLPLVLLLVLDMVLLDMELLLDTELSLDTELLLVPALLEALLMPDMESVKLMLMLMLDTVMLPQLPPLPLSAPVSQSGPATRFPSP